MTATEAEPSANGDIAVRTPNVIEMAIAKGMDAASITQLVELVRQERRDQAEREYTEAIRSVSARVGVILKSKQGSKAKYAPMEEVNYVLTPAYTAAGLALSFSEADCPFADKGWKRHVCDVRHVSGHKERYHLDMPLDNSDGKNQGMSPMAGAVSTGSWIQRVLLSRIFNLTISGTDLDGGNGNSVKPVQPEEIAELQDLMTKLRNAGREVDEGAFLNWLGAESFAVITVKQFEKAKGDLARKIEQAKKGGGRG